MVPRRCQPLIFPFSPVFCMPPTFVLSAAQHGCSVVRRESSVHVEYPARSLCVRSLRQRVYLTGTLCLLAVPGLDLALFWMLLNERMG